MHIKQRKASTDPRLRSLLQKAARRGYSDLVESIAEQLIARGDSTWLRSRAVVITFEECWPLAQHLSLSRDPESKIAALVPVTKAAKQKDAAGLGALAFAFHEGDQSMMRMVPDEWYVRMVSKALDRPASFFQWASTRAKSESASAIVSAAQRYLAAATWGWDKACILAGALLAVTSQMPVCKIEPEPTETFPYWVAIDKHTPEGKEVLHKVGTELNISYRHLIWSGFYYESATVNLLMTSVWFEAERSWRLSRAGLTPEASELLWHRVRHRVADRLADAARLLREDTERKLPTLLGLFDKR